MEQEDLTKLAFFTGYNYYLRFFNIKRKIEDLERNADKLQKIISDNYKPILFQGGEISKHGKKILEVKKLEANYRSEDPNEYSGKMTVNSIPYTEEGIYYLMVEIISETTQYCADLASVILGLKDFKTKKSTFSQIKDTRIKKWFQDINKPSRDDFAEVLNLPPLNELPPGERFNFNLNYERFLWNKRKIGNFYWYNYDYLYTPYRHGMKGSFFRDPNGVVYCRTLTKDKKFNFFLLSKESIEECSQICELMYSIFHNDLGLVLISKGFSPIVKNLRFKVPEEPNLPNRSFNSTSLKNKFRNLKDIPIHHFTTNNIAEIYRFIKESKINLDFHYKKMKKGTSFFIIDSTSYYLDTFFSYSKKLNTNEFIVICNSPLAYFIELAHISMINNRNYDLTIGQIKEYLFHYLTVEKNLDYIFKDPKEMIRRTNQIRALCKDILKDFPFLIGLYHNKNVFEELEISDEELNYFIYLYEKRIISLLNTKTYMKNLYPDIVMQILINSLIIHYFKIDNTPIEKYAQDLNIEDFQNFLKRTSELLEKFVKNEIKLEILLDLMNLLFETTNKIESNP